MIRGLYGLAVLCVVLFASPRDARAGFVITLETSATLSAGEYQYLYALTNNSTAGEFVFDFAIDVAPGAAAHGFDIPLGWELSYLPGDPVVEFLVTPAGADGLDNVLRVGESVSFSFQSAFAPASSAYTVLGDAGGDIQITGGNTLSPLSQSGGGPVPTPAPGALVLIFSGLPFAVGRSWWCRRQSSRRAR